CREVFRHWLLVEIAGVLPEPGAWVQRRAWARAGNRNRRDAGQSHVERHHRYRRRRYGVDRHGAVHTPATAQSAADLRDRGQRRLWADEGTVLGNGRGWLQVQGRRD